MHCNDKAFFKSSHSSLVVDSMIRAPMLNEKESLLKLEAVRPCDAWQGTFSLLMFME